MERQNCLMVLVFIILGAYSIIFGAFFVILGAFFIIFGAFFIIFGSNFVQCLLDYTRCFLRYDRHQSFFKVVSIKHGLRTTDYELQTGYKTLTGYKTRTLCGILKRRTKLCVTFSCKVSISGNTRRCNTVENIHNHKVISP